jgi:uncharacterized protein (TIGR02444 family)
VAAACIELQDSAGIDVNVMFYVLFLATRLRQIDRAEAERIDAQVKAWRELAVIPLRALRRRLKTGIAPLPATDTDALRSEVKRIELETERIEQQFLERQMPADSLGSQAESAIAAARSNLAAYGSLFGGLPEAPSAVLLAAYSQHVA